MVKADCIHRFEYSHKQPVFPDMVEKYSRKVPGDQAVQPEPLTYKIIYRCVYCGKLEEFYD